MKTKLNVPCTKLQLKKIRRFVRQQLKDVPISQREKERVTLAIDEASSNAIIHGHQCDESKNIEIVFKVTEEQLKVKIYDIGDKDFNPVLHYKKDIKNIIQNKQKGGMGLKLIHEVMDEVDYYTQNDKYICALTKELISHKN